MGLIATLHDLCKKPREQSFGLWRSLEEQFVGGNKESTTQLAVVDFTRLFGHLLENIGRFLDKLAKLAQDPDKSDFAIVLYNLIGLDTTN